MQLSSEDSFAVANAIVDLAEEMKKIRKILEFMTGTSIGK